MTTIQQTEQYQTVNTLLSKPEMLFLENQLEKYINPLQYKIFPQVAYSAFMKYMVVGQDRTDISAFSKWYVDFLICDEQMHPVCIVELDDISSHDNPKVQAKDKKKEEISQFAKLPIFRFRFSSVEDFTTQLTLDIAQKMRDLLNHLYTKTCPTCNELMKIQCNKQSYALFWACSLFDSKDPNPIKHKTYPVTQFKETQLINEKIEQIDRNVLQLLNYFNQTPITPPSEEVTVYEVRRNRMTCNSD